MPDESKKPGRPRATLTNEQVVELQALSAFLTQEQIADYFGIHVRTLANIFEREPDVYTAYKKGAIRAVAKSAQTLTKIAWGYTEFDSNGDPTTIHPPDRTALMFHLKTKGGWRETDRIEITGADGKDLEPAVDWSKVPTDTIRQVLAAQVQDDDDTTPEQRGLH